MAFIAIHEAIGEAQAIRSCYMKRDMVVHGGDHLVVAEHEDEIDLDMQEARDNG